MRKKSISSIKGDCGAVQVVEAALVYPIVIFVVAIFFFLGNLFYQQAKVDAIAIRGAQKLAAYYADPFLIKGIPTNSETANLDPYRYLFGNKEAEAAVKKFVEAELADTGTGLFPGMEIDAKVKQCKIDNYIVYHTAKVEIQYTIQIPLLELIDGLTIYRYSTGTATAAGDPAEFMRNIDMVLDYAEITGLTEKIQQTVGQFTGK